MTPHRSAPAVVRGVTLFPGSLVTLTHWSEANAQQTRTAEFLGSASDAWSSTVWQIDGTTVVLRDADIVSVEPLNRLVRGLQIAGIVVCAVIFLGFMVWFALGSPIR